MLKRYTHVEAEKLAKKPGSFAMGTVLRIGVWRVMIYTQDHRPSNGADIAIPFALLPTSIAKADSTQRAHVLVEGVGHDLYWPDLDEGLYIPDWCAKATFGYLGDLCKSQPTRMVRTLKTDETDQLICLRNLVWGTDGRFCALHRHSGCQCAVSESAAGFVVELGFDLDPAITHKRLCASDNAL